MKRTSPTPHSVKQKPGKLSQRVDSINRTSSVPTKQTKSIKKKAKRKVPPGSRAGMGGRPTVYNSEVTPIQAYKFCLLGATEPQLADFFQVTVFTIQNWKRIHSEFYSACYDAGAIADAEVAASLYRRATGYEYTERHYLRRHIRDAKGGKVLDNSGLPTFEMTLSSKSIKHIAADISAAKFWLWNRTKRKSINERWTDSHHLDHTTNGKDIAPQMIDSDMTPKEACDVYLETLRRVNE